MNYKPDNSEHAAAVRVVMGVTKFHINFITYVKFMYISFHCYGIFSIQHRFLKDQSKGNSKKRCI